MELTVESLIEELGLELASGHESAKAHVRWVHSTELPDPTPWLRGGELLLTTGLQLTGPKVQRFEYPKGERGYTPFVRAAVRASAGLEPAPFGSNVSNGFPDRSILCFNR